MSPQPDQDTDRSVLSWESVLDASDTETKTEISSPEPVVPAPVAPLVSDVGPAPALGDSELTIAPLSLDPLSLDPLPPIVAPASDHVPASLDHGDVLGDVHLELPPLELDDSVVPAPPRPDPVAEVSSGPVAAAPEAPVEPAVADVIELTIAPLDIPDLTPSGRVPAMAPEPIRATDVAPTPTPTPTPSPSAVDTPTADAAPRGAAATAPAPVPEADHDPARDTNRPAAAVAGLPDDAVPHDASPTTVVAELSATPTSGSAGSFGATQAPVPNLPSSQPNQAAAPQVARTVAPSKAEPTPLSRKDRKHQEKLKQQQQKAALKRAKAATSRSGAGGVALFFTLLVLVGLIAGAIIFGRPYLFPDEWDEAARPYGEAVETARGSDIDEPLTVQRRAADVFATSMTAQLVGPWESDLPTWRSLGLISGSVDAGLLRELVADWTAAYYSTETAEVIANDAAGVEVLDAAIAEAMAAAALDQETGWSSSIDDALLDSPALTRAIVTASSHTTAAATSFGAADTSVRDIGVSTFLPPVLEYRVNAPLAFAEFSTDDPTQRSADFDALRLASQLQLSGEPELAVGDTLVSSQQLTDRTYWYLVFASYIDTATAYAASNDLIQASLATADSAGTHCTYATFSGTDVAGTARVSDVLQQWVSAVPAEMTAGVSTLANGTMQLRTCDPGAGFESGARFGIGREIARLRSVELAAVAAIPAVDGATADRAAAITAVRDGQLGLPMSDLAFDATFAESADLARTLAMGSNPTDPAE
jgi:hypothetical protein